MKKTNELFGKFDDVLKSACRVPLLPPIGDFWGQKKKLTFVDMFCGIGGFHTAAKSLGMECVFACDIDADCRKVYEHNYHIKPESDICRINPEMFLTMTFCLPVFLVSRFPSSETGEALRMRAARSSLNLPRLSRQSNLAHWFWKMFACWHHITRAKHYSVSKRF